MRVFLLSCLFSFLLPCLYRLLGETTRPILLLVSHSPAQTPSRQTICNLHMRQELDVVVLFAVPDFVKTGSRPLGRTAHSSNSPYRRAETANVGTSCPMETMVDVWIHRDIACLDGKGRFLALLSIEARSTSTASHVNPRWVGHCGDQMPISVGCSMYGSLPGALSSTMRDFTMKRQARARSCWEFVGREERRS